ncbi:putative tetraspanin/Peripherin [Helianthus annuus]|nr:putative tetraspanin/Peripherin [Helianthus annuus]KAJ0958742.1 putative tetraspanin/Peripherin [Helianthus annuus]
MRTTNHLIGMLNFLTFLLSIPILGGGIWLSTRANNTDCMRFLQWPVIVIGVAIMIVSIAGFAGACYRNTLLMYLYLWVMFLIIVVLIGFVIFAYVVTDKGSGRSVPNRAYKDYYLPDYSGWLKDRVASDEYWRKISSCIRDSGACSNSGRVVGGYPESAEMYYLRKLSSIESGCCKPPSECGFTYVNETTWNPVSSGMMVNNRDCIRWSNDQEQRCYNCNSCKAGVLASLRKSWRKVSIINIVVLIILIIVYVVACAAFRNNRRMDNHEQYGETRMEKSRPSWIRF